MSTFETIAESARDCVMKTIKKANVLLASNSLPSCVAGNIRPSLSFSLSPPLPPTIILSHSFPNRNTITYINVTIKLSCYIQTYTLQRRKYKFLHIEISTRVVFQLEATNCFLKQTKTVFSKRNYFTRINLYVSSL